MTKKKKSDSLYELISSGGARKGDMEMNVPAWMEGRDKGEARDVPEQPAEPIVHPPQEPEPPEAPVAPLLPAGALAGAPVPPPSPTSHREPPPLVSTTGGRLTFSLNHVSCVVAAVGLVLLLAGAFALGRADRRGREPVTTENGTEKTEAGLSNEVSTPATRQRESGKYYMIIQRLGPVSEAVRKEGERIVAFCAERGEQATVEPFDYPNGKRYLAVWSLTPFDSPTGESNEAHATWIEGVGKVYFAKHRTHKFQQRVSKDGPFAPTFVPAK